MKIRLAKKIMKQQVKNVPNLSMHRISLYWVFAWNRYYPNYGNPFALRYKKADHRITKAMSLTSKISTIVDTSKKKKV